VTAKYEQNNKQKRQEKKNIKIKESNNNKRGHAVAHLVEALRYKPEGRGFVSRWCHWIFSLT
jgi:hypothetical protein